MSILCYHSLDPEWSSPLAVPPQTFARHAQWLATHRTVVPAETAAGAMTRRGTLPRRTSAITFDDGYADLHAHALPVLARLGLPATVFVVAATVADGKEVDWVDDPPAHPLRTLSRDQIREMQDAGVTFGSHSLVHADLTTLTYERCVEDLKSSREILEDLLERQVSLLAYPRGRHSPSVRRAAAAAGYRVAFSLPERSEAFSSLSAPRVGVYPHNGTAALRVKTAQGYVRARTAAGGLLARVRR